MNSTALTFSTSNFLSVVDRLSSSVGLINNAIDLLVDRVVPIKHAIAASCPPSGSVTCGQGCYCQQNSFCCNCVLGNRYERICEYGFGSCLNSTECSAGCRVSSCPTCGSGC